MSMLAKIEATKAEINLRNLQRHDPTIEDIVSSTSYVTVYYNDGAEWIKTGIEGPMFLFSRSQAPLYGFFVLNRQGLEYTREFLTEESDVTVDGEFILYEPRPDADRATGIWVAEEKDRIELCRRMEELRLRAKAPAVAVRASPLDFLFASVAPSNSANNSTRSPAASPQVAPAVLPKGTPSTLNMLFASSAASAASRSPPKPASPQASSQPPVLGINLLDTLFKSALAPPATTPTTTQAKPQDAGDLLAMLGHSAKPSTATKPAGSESKPESLAAIPSILTASSTYPSPAVAPAPPAHASAAVPSSSPTTQAGALTTRSATLPNPANKSLFSAPLLSHDVFASLPPIGSRPKQNGDNSIPTTDHAEVAPVRPRTPATTPAAEKPVRTRESIRVSTTSTEPAPSPATESKPKPSDTTPPRKAASPAVPSSTSDAKKVASSPGVNRAEALEVVDAAAQKAQIGLGVHEKEPLDQKQFIKALNELIQRPAFATSLYARYLERYEDDHATV
ncbi:hypothetical protein MVLG_01619 [Microbotryum lychnidis-dioicae p1A1 Lamole]|uniref:mRNA-decapping enzyme C-terminal domain-containing protein n=1 Tax=Microbotryum lychnidis-dioicae (strain p1A1 Lamole / MvSl-1064) TaxID=683840 RepID=U5H2N5_USTV1|nr:hypothetical protein MVLG_01619 [Microbotryum lychnidis-dioicae p1A1 Lamole]|eukprot:KDE08138.1 hypothetical protein MVLG_01619 [Microbotryum lychnidis-dioicae p1A1 Lamole]